MFRIVDFTALLRYVAIATVVVSLVTYELLRGFWLHDLPAVRIASIAPWVAFLVIFVLTTSAIARGIWKLMRTFNSSLFPDLNGTWEGEIITDGDIRIPARARIMQTLLETRIDLHTETSKSITLETTPTMESGQYKLYYIYRSLPKNPDWPSYTGSTIFDVRALSSDQGTQVELSGYYYTDRKSRGRVRLRQISDSTSGDVSYY